MKTADIKNMTATERLEVMEALWDSLIKDEPMVKSPDWHKEILRKRKKKIDNGTAEYISLDELKKQN